MSAGNAASLPLAAAGRPPTVAVLGAGGIGRHHANWWQVEGARLVAILGRTPESARLSAAKLKGLFGYEGPVFTDLEQLLRASRPDIVDVCSPAPLHFEQARLALARGCHVLCEKPLVFDNGLTAESLRAQAAELARLATEGGLRFGLCSQHAVAARECAALWGACAGAPPRRIRLELRSPARGRPPDPARCWIDLGPHLVAALQTLLPGAAPDWQGMELRSSGYNADVTLSLRSGKAPAVSASLAVGFTTGEPANVRRIGLDDTLFDLLGEAGPDGLFRMRYRAGAACDEARADPMRLLIRDFLAGRPPLDAAAALRNEDWLLRIHESLR
jgi:predicted dehydrogenase